MSLCVLRKTAEYESNNSKKKKPRQKLQKKKGDGDSKHPLRPQTYKPFPPSPPPFNVHPILLLHLFEEKYQPAKLLR